MSEAVNEATEPTEASTAKRKTLTLAERIKVVDYLRARAEPIVADSNTAIAAVVSEATNVDINWQQLKYMIDDLAEMNLSAKVHVKSLLSGEDAITARLADLELKVEKLETRMLAIIEDHV